MAQRNVETVRRIYERWGRGDFRAGVELYDPYAVLVLRPEFPDAGAYCGPDARELSDIAQGEGSVVEKGHQALEELGGGGDVGDAPGDPSGESHQR